jgi:hypothetical protein
MNKAKEAPVPRNLKKFLSLITDQLFCIDDDIVVLTEPQLKKAKFSYDDTQFFLNAMNKHKLYSVLKRRYDFHFISVPKKSETKERLLSSWNWQMMFSEKIIEVRYFIKISSREELYEFCGLPTEERKQKGKTTKNGFKTPEVFIESRSQEGDEDHHILLGDRTGKNEKAHMIIDGKTGEQRVEDNRGEPTDTAQHFETIITLPNGKKVRTTRETLEEIPNNNSSRPRLDISEFLTSGGPHGQEMSFKVINIGNESAMDMKFQFIADDFFGDSLQNLMHLLTAGDTTRHYTTAIYSSSALADKQLSNLKLVLLYKSANGQNYQSGRYLIQELRADGKFNLSLGGYYE